MNLHLHFRLNIHGRPTDDEHEDGVERGYDFIA